MKAQSGRAVLKPWDSNGGRGVVTSGTDRNGFNDRTAHENGQHYVIAQPFLEGAEKGGKRILLFNGEPVGAILRVPSQKDYRGNMHVETTVEA